MLTDNGGSRNRTGGLSVSLANPDGRILGGGVGGVLIASGPVQVTAFLVLAYYYYYYILKSYPSFPHVKIKIFKLLN